MMPENTLYMNKTWIMSHSGCTLIIFKRTRELETREKKKTSTLGSTVCNLVSEITLRGEGGCGGVFYGLRDANEGCVLRN